MPRGSLRIVAALFVAVAHSTEPQAQAVAQADTGPYARIAVLRPHDGDTVDFEAGYLRHLDWHRQAGDRWTWYGWTVTFGERQRWFIYASFGHSAASLDHPVPPADDERDNVANVTAHARFAGNALYQFLPSLSHGSGVPTPAARLELITVDLHAGAGREFERVLSGAQAAPHGELLWYRLVAGATAPRYVRLRPRPTLSALIGDATEPTLPDGTDHLVAKTAIEILTLRPAMSYGLPPGR